VYLSCNPARLGRDLALLTTAGFRIAELQPYDFFPQTPRIEVLCLLQR
jgi:23S rRNA (uracil1939-C5)-methyltransferase